MFKSNVHCTNVQVATSVNDFFLLLKKCTEVPLFRQRLFGDFGRRQCCHGETQCVNSLQLKARYQLWSKQLGLVVNAGDHGDNRCSMVAADCLAGFLLATFYASRCSIAVCVASFASSVADLVVTFGHAGLYVTINVPESRPPNRFSVEAADNHWANCQRYVLAKGSK